MALKEVAAVAALAAALCAAPSAWALSLGRLTVQSALGESLRAEIDVTSLTPDEAANLRVRVAPPDAYRIAGVDYNPVLPATTVSLQRRADGTAFLRILSDRPVQEPFVDVILELSWSSGRLLREYTLLFDPPTVARPSAAPATVATPAATTAAAESAPVAPPAPPAPAPAEPAPVAAAPAAAAPRPVETGERPSTAAPAASDAGGDYRVRNGDTLGGIARRNLSSGVSLEQMLVGLYRGNSHAFMGSNMNRLKAGVVLSIPSGEQAAAIDAREARRVIQVQSADFNAYRQRLAGAVPAQTQDSEPARRSAGKVEAEVQDRKQAATPTPDRLQLDKGRVAAAASAVPAPEDRIARERAQKEAASRASELAKNLEELKKLQAASSAALAASSAARATTTVAAASAPAATSKLPSLPVPPVAVPPAASALAAAPAASPAQAAASAVAPMIAAASEPASAVPPVDAASAPVIAAASQPPVAASRPPVVVPPIEAEEPSLVDSLMENPLLLPGAGLLLALLAGFGYYRFRNRNKEEAGVTSFLESRLQPDSFFGASGGQRIDTRDAVSGAPSSMSYSLSQIDAIGDVDPVAEADVYLAYGRDLQAEEILKEAMRSNPERLAIRTKLLEVYAKRRDVKGYELLAGELYGLTGGQGEDWLRAQELGRSIDPENPLYEPGGQPGAGSTAEAGGGEMLGASTMPQSVVPSPSRFEHSVPDLNLDDPTPSGQSAAVDLDISVPGDLGEAPTARMSGFHSTPAAFSPSVPPSGLADNSRSLEFELQDLPRSSPAPSASPRIDLGDISLDLDAPAPTVASTPLDMGASLEMGLDEDDADPLARKIELAEEFHQIGDHEGARDLLQEVIEKADGALKARAQAMLSSLN